MDIQSRDLLKELECPVCVRYLAPPISLCAVGHSVCHSCRLRLDTCPLCRGPFTNSRSIVLENVVLSLKYPCRNEPEGCPEVLPLGLIKDHEAVCSLGTHPCPMNKFPEIQCGWIGRLDYLKKHITEIHKSHRIIEGLCFQSISLASDKAVIFALGEIFLYLKLKQKNKWYFAMIMVGTEARAAKYKTVFTLRGANGVNIIQKSLIMSGLNEDFDHLFSTYQCLQLDEGEEIYFTSYELRDDNILEIFNLTVEISVIGV